MGRTVGTLAACAVVAVLLCATSTFACTKEEYLAKFGESYTLAGVPEADAPALSSGRVTGVVTYSTLCATGGSSFTADTIVKEDFPLVAVLVRQPDGSAPCAAGDVLDEPAEWTGRVSASLPAGVGTPEYIVFPPGSDFELYILREKQQLDDAFAQAAGDAKSKGTGVAAAAGDAEAVPGTAARMVPVNDSGVDDATTGFDASAVHRAAARLTATGSASP